MRYAILCLIMSSCITVDKSPNISLPECTGSSTTVSTIDKIAGTATVHHVCKKPNIIYKD
jgi:hypothetical protein